MKGQPENPIYAHDTLEFVTIAAEYCAFLEQCQERSLQEFADTLLKLLPLLYMKEQMLPETEGSNTFLPDDQVTEEDYNYIRNLCYAILRHHDDYELLVWDDDMQTEESRWCSVSEGLADIYQPLRNFVVAYQQRVEDCMADALWQVRDSFELFWGQTLLDTLRQLHRIRYSQNLNSDEEDS